uniref:LRRNT domain-containing protein n=1 Tax=Amblyomma maculatum TaxID=34609 RepID=G3MMB6_AMBMU
MACEEVARYTSREYSTFFKSRTSTHTKQRQHLGIGSEIMGASHTLALFVLFSCTLALAAAVDPCPALESLRPCTCDYTGINCLKAKSTAELANAFSGKEKTIHRALWIQNRPIVKIENNTFGDYAFAKVYVDLNTKLTLFQLSSLRKSSMYLNELSLYGNNLRGIDSRWLPRFQKLRILNLAKNNLSYVPVAAFVNPSLETLSLSENPITSIGAGAFERLPSLKLLDLSFIRVKTLDAYSFSIPKHHPELAIRLYVGKLETIEENAFYGTAPLELNLQFNNLKDFNAPVFQPLIMAMASNARKHNMITVARIATNGNRFSCTGCEFSWLTTLKDKPELLLMLVDFHCRDNTPVWNITNSLIGCPYNARP